jgi:hypothetical protein
MVHFIYIFTLIQYTLLCLAFFSSAVTQHIPLEYNLLYIFGLVLFLLAFCFLGVLVMHMNFQSVRSYFSHRGYNFSLFAFLSWHSFTLISSWRWCRRTLALTNIDHQNAAAVGSHCRNLQVGSCYLLCGSQLLRSKFVALLDVVVSLS